MVLQNQNIWKVGKYNTNNRGTKNISNLDMWHLYNRFGDKNKIMYDLKASWFKSSKRLFAYINYNDFFEKLYLKICHKFYTMVSLYTTFQYWNGNGNSMIEIEMA